MRILLSLAALVAVLLWPLVLSFSTLLPGSDISNRGMAEFCAMLAALLLWLALIAALFLVAGMGLLPASAVLAMLVLLLATGASAMAVLHLIKEGQPVRWMLAVPALTPPMTLLWLACSVFPALRLAVPATAANAAVWPLLFLLALLPWRRCLRLRSGE